MFNRDFFTCVVSCVLLFVCRCVYVDLCVFALFFNGWTELFTFIIPDTWWCVLCLCSGVCSDDVVGSFSLSGKLINIVIILLGFSYQCYSFFQTLPIELIVGLHLKN